MSIYFVSFVVICGGILVTPYLLCVVLKFALWKYQFSGKPSQQIKLLMELKTFVSLLTNYYNTFLKKVDWFSLKYDKLPLIIGDAQD